MNDFFRTMMGQKFYQGDVPRIAKALENIAQELKRQNDMAETVAEPVLEVAEAKCGRSPGCSGVQCECSR